MKILELVGDRLNYNLRKHKDYFDKQEEIDQEIEEEWEQLKKSRICEMNSRA